jgi:hypothetical protein
MEIVGEAHSFSEGIQMMAEIKPEVLLAEKESMESGRGLFSSAFTPLLFDSGLWHRR